VKRCTAAAALDRRQTLQHANTHSQSGRSLRLSPLLHLKASCHGASPAAVMAVTKMRFLPGRYHVAARRFTCGIERRSRPRQPLFEIRGQRCTRLLTLTSRRTEQMALWVMPATPPASPVSLLGEQPA
jgi:hypothetical protein